MSDQYRSLLPFTMSHSAEMNITVDLEQKLLEYRSATPANLEQPYPSARSSSHGAQNRPNHS